MPADFYYLPHSGPCRAVMLGARAVNFKLNMIEWDLFAGKHLTPKFLKLNPQHCVPTLNDNGFILCESRAILGYLVNKYAKDDSLYPKDPEKRAIVDQRLYFDIGNIYQKLIDYYLPVVFENGTLLPQRLKALEGAFEIFNTYLEGHEWAAGDSITIADFSLVATVATADVVVDFDVSKYVNVYKWYNKCKKSMEGYDELNHAGCVIYKKLFDQLNKK